jgi:hypothetical protein
MRGHILSSGNWGEANEFSRNCVTECARSLPLTAIAESANFLLAWPDKEYAHAQDDGADNKQSLVMRFEEMKTIAIQDAEDQQQKCPARDAAPSIERQLSYAQ